jgi:hypothetical protein
VLILDNPQADGSDMLHWHTVKYSHWQRLAHALSICISVAGSGCRMDYNDDEFVYSVSGGGWPFHFRSRHGVFGGRCGYRNNVVTAIP